MHRIIYQATKIYAVMALRGVSYQILCSNHRRDAIHHQASVPVNLASSLGNQDSPRVVILYECPHLVHCAGYGFS
jgi:hypothetical protein